MTDHDEYHITNNARGTTPRNRDRHSDCDIDRGCAVVDWGGGLVAIGEERDLVLQSSSTERW